MMTNASLHRAKRVKNDEFYTRLTDIEKELKNYKDFFKEKVVYCNCDRVDGENRSNFFVYFTKYFKEFGLKRLICTSYNKGGKGKLFIYDGDTNLNDIIDMDGDGDFRSEECVKWLKECDVVVTNPPFSLFRDFVAQLMEYNKKFLIIGNMNAITYKEIFPLIKDNKLWLGASIKSGDRKFYVPDNYPLNASGCGIDEKGKRFIRVKGVRWFTNIEDAKRNLPLDLYKKYNPKDYPKYDNYDAINVDKTSDIPMDYDGVMGVPITFLDKYCPTQFEIVDINPHFFSLIEQGLPKPKQLTLHNVGRKKDVYARILIRRK